MKKQVEFVEVVGEATIGARCTLRLSNYNTVQTSRVIAVSDDFIETKNTIYVKYKGNNPMDWQTPQPVQQPQQQVMYSQPQQVQQQIVPQPQQPYQPYIQEQQSVQPQQPYSQPQYNPQPVQQPQYNPQPQQPQQTNEYKNQLINQMATQEDPRIVTDDVQPSSQPVSTDYAERLKHAKTLKIISDVDSSKPGT